MTKEYFRNNALMVIELDGDYGKHRATMKGSEVDAYLARHCKSGDEFFSDSDYSRNQDDPEIGNIIDTAWKNFETDPNRWGSFYKAIDALLEDETPAPAKRVWTEDEIRELVQTNDKVLYGALKKLYAEQTADEQRAGETKVHNNAGFNGADSRFLSSVSQFLIREGFLTTKQKAVTRRKLVKYTRQLTRLANA